MPITVHGGARFSSNPIRYSVELHDADCASTVKPLVHQYKLLKRGLKSSAMTTDDGVDLVVYSPHLKDAITVQVKTNHRAMVGSR